MTIDYSDPTDPRAIALRFANPTFQRDWSPNGRPAWPGVVPSEAFRRWIGDRLRELKAFVFEEMEKEMGKALTPDHLAQMTDALGSEAWAGFTQRADAAIKELRKTGRKPTLHEIENKMKRMAEPKRRGRTRSPSNPKQDAAIAAAWDIWRLRRVILPRFWPEEATGEFHLDKLELARVASGLHDCTPQEAIRQYLDNRIASE